MHAAESIIRPVHRRCVAAWVVTVLAFATTAPALTVNVPRLPAPTFADREASGDTAIPENISRDLQRFRLELAFDATPSNNVQVAFGRDAEPIDEKLAAEETDFIIGWDSGEWFLRPPGLKDRHVFVRADGQTPRRRTLRAAIRISAQGKPISAVFSDDMGDFAFEGLLLNSPPSWLAPENWSLLRVTVRGAEIAEEDISIRFQFDGAMIILR